MTQKFHCRFTPYDISGHTFDFLEEFQKYIIGRETKDKYGNETELHYHIYIEDVEHGPQTIRNSIKEHLRIPKGGRGKNNKYYSFIQDWKDPGYIAKWNDVVKSKGYTEREIMDHVISGKEKYLVKLDSRNEVERKNSPVQRQSKPKPNVNKDIIGLLYTWYDEYYKEHNTTPSKAELVRRAMAITRQYKGINMFQIRDFCQTVIFDYGEYIRSRYEGTPEMELYFSAIAEQTLLINKISQLV